MKGQNEKHMTIRNILLFLLSLTSAGLSAQDLTIASGATVTIESGSYISSGGNLSITLPLEYLNLFDSYQKKTE